MTEIKICGIKDTGTALAVASAGADYLGLVFAPGRRMVSTENALKIVESVPASSEKLKIVGVFVNTPAPEVNRIAAHCHLDWVQLSGHEDWEYYRQIEKPVFKVIHVYRKSNNAEIIHEIDNGYHTLSENKFQIILDTGTENRYGGTGDVFDWEIAAEISRRYPVMIAGGLNPENVSTLLQSASPWGVDVSTGVETDGKKDPRKINDFIEAVRAKRSKDVTG